MMTSKLDYTQGKSPDDLACLLAERDVNAQRGEYLFALPSYLTQRLSAVLADKRDLPAALLLVNVMLTTLPVAVAMVIFCHSHFIGLLYLLVNYVCYLQRFMLTLHFTQHRRLFNRGAHPIRGMPTLLHFCLKVDCSCMHISSLSSQLLHASFTTMSRFASCSCVHDCSYSCY